MSEAVNTGSWFDKVKTPAAWGKLGGGGDLSAMPFLRRFAGSLRGVNPVKQNAIVQSALVPFDIAGRFNEGEHPIRAVGRPLVQLGGGLGGGTVGGLLGFPTTGPGGFVTTAAGATGGYHGAGALFDQVFPKGQVNQRLGDYGRNFSKGANFLFNEYLLGLPTGSSTKPSTGMANIPVGTKEAELEMRQQQGGYIPPGMTTSAGVPVEAQAGGPELDPWGRTKTYEAADGSMVNRSNVFTPHYETGEDLGVMTRNQRKAYDLAAAKAGF